jgi:hypothetical protein
MSVLEKAAQPTTGSTPVSSTREEGIYEDHNVTAIPTTTASTKLQRFANRLEDLAGVESRGIERVPPELRERKMALADYLGIGVMWFSIKYVCSVLGKTSVGDSPGRGSNAETVLPIAAPRTR